jgi:hypothetical protein
MVGLVIAMVIAVPVVLFPVALIWYINVGGMFLTFKEARAKELAAVKATK